MHASTLDLIGGTPLVALDRAHDGPGRIVAKAEFLQPGGSVKDRAARAIVLAARADGRLRPGMPVVEMTSGNMGAGLAVVCAALGHPFIAAMSAGNSPARARMIATTEVTRAYSQAATITQEQMAAQGVQTTTQWVTWRDDRVCPICGPLHNRFDYQAEFPYGPPAHVSCRCWLAVVRV